MLNFDEQYQSMTDDELLNVARDSQDLRKTVYCWSGS
jgi:hypothetical protein